MNLRRLLRTPILVGHVTQAGPPDEMGDPTEELTWTRFLGYVWQEGVTEETANTAIAGETWRLALDRTASGFIDAGDRIVAAGTLDAGGNPTPGIGERFDVTGPPWPARNPRTQLIEYVTARVERST